MSISYIEVKITEAGKSYYNYDNLSPATPGSAGIDLKAVEIQKFHNLPYTIRTGIHVWIRDPLLVGLVVPRSSAAITLVNTIGVIDSDYQGEILLKCNLNKEIEVGERIAQLLIVPLANACFSIVPEFNAQTIRGSGGFGSTGLLTQSRTISAGGLI